jgi:hypothetical protein
MIQEYNLLEKGSIQTFIYSAILFLHL